MSEHTVVLVTGSMRSGTSSLAGSLKLLGWHVPQPEVPASPRNAKGHFEPRWVIEFHKRLMRGALVRPSDGSPRAAGAGGGAARGRGDRGRAPRLDRRAGRAAGRGQGPARRRGCSRPGGPPPRPPAATCGCSPRCGTRPRWSAPRTSPGARAGVPTPSAGSRRPPTPRPGSTSRWSPSAPPAAPGAPSCGTTTCSPTGAPRCSAVSEQLDLGLPLDEDRGLDAFLDPGMRRSQLTWDDIVLPDWLRDLAEDAWRQLGALVDDPAGRRRPRPGWTRSAGSTTPITPRRWRSPSTRPGTASAGARPRARPRSGAGCGPSGPGDAGSRSSWPPSSRNARRAVG